MRRFTTLFLCCALALIAFACLGAGGASATAVCNVLEEEPCSEENADAVGTKFGGKLEKGSVVFKAMFEISCKAMTLEGELTEQATPLIGKVTAFSFSECGGCTSKTLNLPYKAEVEATESGNGLMKVGNGGLGKLSAEFVCSGISCTFGTSAGAEFKITGGKPGKATLTKELTLEKEAGSFLCGSKATMQPPQVQLGPPQVIEIRRMTVFCKEAAQPCPDAPTSKIYGPNTLFEGFAEAAKAKLVLSSGTKECKPATVKGESTQKEGMPARVYFASFESCNGPCGAVTIRNLPYVNSSVTYTAGSNGELWIRGFSIETPCGAETCQYGALLVKLKFEGGNPATLKAENIALSQESGAFAVCGNSATWIGTYEVQRVTPLYVSYTDR